MRYSIQDFIQLIAQLRDPEHGCPWDIKQTYQSMIPCLKEEAYEVIEAIEQNNVENLKEAFVNEAKNIIIAQITNAEITGQSVADLLVVLNKEFGLNFTQAEYYEYAKLDYEGLKAVLLERFDVYFTRVFSQLETKVLFDVFREVHLHFLDKLWVNHIDEMQNLREKV